MSKSRALVCLLLTAGILTGLAGAVSRDRIGTVNREQMTTLRGNVHGLARPENDLGRANGGKMIHGVSLSFRPSADQKKDLDAFIRQLGDRSSPNYHKYLTPKQYADRFGMTRNDMNKVVAWLQSEGFANIRVSNGRDLVRFDGSVAQVESVFATEFRNYLVDGKIHFANASNPAVPAALADAVIAVGNLHDFRPKPRVRASSHFTSHTSGNHFLSPADFATIYNLQPLYDAGIDGAGQQIAIVGQTDLIASDLDHFRSAAGLPLKQPTKVLMPDSGNPAIFDGDLVESDLDVEWSGGVAKNAEIIFVYVGDDLNFSVWDSLQYAVDQVVAPFISTSYGFCESGLGSSFSNTVQGWAVRGISQGQTITAASGDDGAADCENPNATSAINGLAVDVPAAVPEVVGVGGTEFFGDAPSTSNTQYWSGSASNDIISSALGYIPEEGWNDTTALDGLSATGGGASIYFDKPFWQAGSGVPSDVVRHVPDVALSASPVNDGYLFCSQLDSKGFPSCTNGFRDSSSSGYLDAVGGTSAGSPTFAAILALLNQYVGNTPPTGLAPVNPSLYQIAATNTDVFHDVTTADNKVPCTSGTTDCPSGTTSIGFAAGAGYDQVTGLGSVDAAALVIAWVDSGFVLSPSAASYQVRQGMSVTATITPSAFNGFTGSITYTCVDSASESTCTGPAGPVDVGSDASFTITTKAPTSASARPFNRDTRIFYAMLLPGLLGFVFMVSSGKRSARSIRMLLFITALGFATLGLGSCGGSSGGGNKDPGTPAGSYNVTVTGTSGTVTAPVSFTLVVVP